MKTHLTLSSGNAKTGPIPVSTSSGWSFFANCGSDFANCGSGGDHGVAVMAAIRRHDLGATIREMTDDEREIYSED
jgi:hypothetical protein